MAVRELRTPDVGRNIGIPLDLEWIEYVRANKSAIERRAATLPGRRTVKKEWQAAWLLRAISCMDLTTLSGDDTPGSVERLCAKAKQPIRQDLVGALGLDEAEGPRLHRGRRRSPTSSGQAKVENEGLRIQVAAVCVYYDLIEVAVRNLRGSGIPVAGVAAGFPHGLTPLRTRIEEIQAALEAGASEIDVVIHRAEALRGEWERLYDEVRAFRDACGQTHLKVIIATGELGTLRNVGKASLVAMMAGADFVKTSTGKESVNATIPVSLVMARSIRDYFERTGFRVGFKPAGGIRTAKQALDWLILMKEELGDRWLRPDLFRIGASTLLADIEMQLEHFATGRYSALNRHPMA